LQNTRDDNNPNLDGMLLFSLESARKLPRELSRRVEQLEAEVLDVRQEKEALEAEVEEQLAQAGLMPERERYLLMLIRDGWFVLMALEEQNPESFARTMDARAHRFLRLGAREVSQRDPNHVVAYVGEAKVLIVLSLPRTLVYFSTKTPASISIFVYAAAVWHAYSVHFSSRFQPTMSLMPRMAKNGTPLR
jgi:hypothetical protein